MAELEHLLSISKDAMNREMFNTGELYGGILYHSEMKLIETPAMIERIHEIDEENREVEYDIIHLYENYLQYLWCLSYSVHVALNEHPSRNSDTETKAYREAIKVFSHGMALNDRPEVGEYRNIPNPETPFGVKPQHMKTTNMLYIYAVLFILLHEIGHHYFGHTKVPMKPDDSKSAEMVADDYAYCVIMELTGQRKEYAIIGMVIATASILLKDGNTGGESHPDPFERLDRLIQKSVAEHKSLVWTYTFVILYLWCIDYGISWKLEVNPPKMFIEDSPYDDYSKIREYVLGLAATRMERMGHERYT